MSKKIILGLSVFIFFFVFKLAHASVVINEIMYNPAGTDTNKEWIELYNNGSDVVSIVSGKADNAWRFDDGSTSLHYINDDLNIPAGGYAILAANKDTFLSEYPNFSGLVADTSMTLNNAGTIKIWNGSKDAGSVVDSVSYDASLGADNDGNSLQLINGSWVAGAPTPGVSDSNVTVDNTSTDDSNASNDISSNDSNDSSNSSNNTVSVLSSSSSSKSKNKIVKSVSNFKVDVLTDSIVFAGNVFEIKSNVLNSSEKISTGKIFWNFGDGTSTEQVNNFQKFNHIYFYPGNYNLSLDYYSNAFNSEPDFSSQMTIKVLPLVVSISKVGDAQDFFIELTNNSNNNLDISSWKLSANNKIFIFPKNTTILANNKITISGKITNFVFGDQNDLKLISSTGEIVFVYNSSLLPKEIFPKNNTEKVVPKNTNVLSNNTDKIEDSSSENKIQNINNDLPASALLGSGEVIKSSNNNFFTIVFIFLLLGVIILVYFIRKNRSIKEPLEGDDFEILDE